MRPAIYPLVIALLTAGPALARDIYVNNISGNDTLLGRSPIATGREDGPVQTIAKALRLARPGDHIVLAATPQPYREQISVQGGKHSGVEGALPLVIDGQGAVIDGMVDVPEDAWESVGGDIFRFAPAIKSHQVFTVEGKRAVRVPAERGARLPPLQPLEWCLLDGYIYFCVPPGQVPQRFYPACAGLQTGITVYDVMNIDIRNVVVRGFALDGVNCHDKAFFVRLQGVKAEDNGRSGISIGGASRVRVESCEAAFNHVVQLRTEGHSHAHVVDSTFDETLAPATQTDGGEIIAE